VAPSILFLAQVGGSGFGVTQILPIVGVFAVMYFVLIKPQQKQLKEHRELLSNLKKGDDVVTQGGVLGKIYAITDKIVTLEVANNVRIRVLKTSVQGKSALTDDVVTVPAKAEEKKEEK
jgi:preprotein translocase subunit YajC